MHCKATHVSISIYVHVSYPTHTTNDALYITNIPPKTLQHYQMAPKTQLVS